MENQAVDAVNLVQNGSYDLSIISLFWRADLVVKLVIIGLFLSSVWSWAIIINKIKIIKKLNIVTKKFEDIFWSTNSLEDLYSKTEGQNNHAMIAVFNKAMIEWLRIKGTKLKEQSESRLNNVLISSINNEIAKLGTNMIFLASVVQRLPLLVCLELFGVL